MFGAIKLAKNADLDRYECSSYSIGFNANSQFSLPIAEWAINVIFGLDYNSSRHTDKKKKIDILVLGKRSTDELDDTAVMAESKYSINISNPRKKICLNLHYNEANCVLYANGVKSINSKQRILK